MTTPPLSDSGAAAEGRPSPPPASTRSGDIRVHESFASRFLEAHRSVRVYLPPGYEADRERRYPVLYLQDGQNLFDNATAFGGREWGVDEAAERLVAEGVIEPLIVVGVDNAGDQRIAEYTPSRDDEQGAGGAADQYGWMLFDELKPMIDATYRTRPEQEHTALGGSSLGGLVSLYLALRHGGKVGRAAILSPSVWWDDQEIVRRVRDAEGRPALRLWLSVGTAEGEEHVANARALRDTLVAKGWSLDRDFRYAEYQGAEHREEAWGRQIAEALGFLFPVASG
ncbi:MAG TPA: alpha/beta hydrolase-fold protein [Gemmatimonadaceae bacterium]|nr:alpha/beta hydrolase-fold protein [Gemmatimonadaceae bacterium]